nr:PREDICTED: ralA-binding protein 1-like isoform X1 [Bemisia tabaci]
MDFESPDVEKDFPGLYASESGRRSNESDFSDESHEKPSKKELLIGKRKEKKEKDLRYATLEGESSVDEDAEIKSPLKSKKSKAFKFSTKKDKDKDKEKDAIEKEKKKDSKKDKEKKKDIKLKDVKDKKKKHSDGASDIADELPIFGVPLETAVKRNPCHDGIDVPLVFRLCVDRIEESLTTEGLYKTTAIKSTIHRLKRAVNQRETIDLMAYDVFTATNLLKSFIKDLPEPVFPPDSVNSFRASENSGTAAQSLVNGLPYFNKQFINWLLIHLKHVVAQEKFNKMTLPVVTSIFSPLLQIDSQILSFLIINSSVFFPNFNLVKYIPPLSPSSTVLPDTSKEILSELKKQESVLGLIHSEMSTGSVSKAREEQLWEVQRMITQLKRKLRSLGRESQPTEPNIKEDEFSLNLSLQKPVPCFPDNNPPSQVEEKREKPINENSTRVSLKDKEGPVKVPDIPPKTQEATRVNDFLVKNSEAPVKFSEVPLIPNEVPLKPSEVLSKHTDNTYKVKEVAPQLKSATEMESLAEDLNSVELKDSVKARALLFETEELLNMILDLKTSIVAERKEIEKLRDLLSKAGLSSDVDLCLNLDTCDISEQNTKLRKETLFLENQEMNLVKNIIKEREAIIDLRVQIRMLEQSEG